MAERGPIIKALVCGLLALLLGAAGYYAWSRHQVAFDDAYITYRYADNLVSGYGPVYNRGERVEGYTNFAWMLLSALGIWAGRDPFAFTRGIGVASHVLMLAVIAWFASRWLLAASWGHLVLVVVLAVLVVPDGFAAMAGSGLETSFVACLLVLAGALLYAGDFSRWRARVGLALILSLSVLTRLDAMLSVGAATAVIAFDALRSNAGVRAGARNALATIGPVLVLVVVWTLWRRLYYGDFLPNTFYAKAANVTHAEPGWLYLRAFVRTHPQVPALIVLAAAAFASPDRGLWRVALFASLTLVAEMAYVVRVGGDFMEFRFMWQLYGLLVFAAIGGLATVASQSMVAAMAVTLCILGVLGRPLEGEPRFTLQSLEEMDSFVKTGELVGPRLRQVLPKGTVISTTLAGTMAYFSKLTVIDQWGLNDRYVAHMPFQAFMRGHVKFAPMPYLQSRKVNLYFGHPVICSCSNLCREAHANVFVRLSDDRCVRSWYLTPTPKLTAHVCSHKQWFALSKVTCPTPAPRKPAAPAVPLAPLAPPGPPRAIARPQ